MKSIGCFVRMVVVGVLMVEILASGTTASAQTAASEAWSRVQRIGPGTPILVSVRGGAAMHYQMAFADEARLFVVAVKDPNKTRDVERLLAFIGESWSLVLSGAKEFSSGSLRLSNEGIFDAERKVADLVALPIDDVTQIRFEGRRGRKLVGAAVGGAIGCAAGATFAYRLSRPGQGCGDQCGYIPLFGGAGAGLGYLLAARREGRLVYQAPSPVRALDETLWQRVRQALPPSLRAGTGRPAARYVPFRSGAPALAR